MLRATEQARRDRAHPQGPLPLAGGGRARRPGIPRPSRGRTWPAGGRWRTRSIRQGIDGAVDGGPFQGAYHVRRQRRWIADREHHHARSGTRPALTVACLASLDRSPGYPITEVVLVDNGSTEPETQALRQQLEARPGHPGARLSGPVQLVGHQQPRRARPVTPTCCCSSTTTSRPRSEGWLHALVELGQRPDVGAVGARLVYPDGSVQHAGVVIGLGGHRRPPVCRHARRRDGATSVGT